MSPRDMLAQMGCSSLRGLAGLLLGLALLLAGRASRGDMATVYWIDDGRGRVAALATRGSTDVAMRAETVVLVPFFEASLDRTGPLLFVNARFALENEGPSVEVQAGFPEAKARVRYYSADYEERTEKVLHPASILRFDAELDGRPLEVKPAPAGDGYRRWFVFAVPLAARQRAVVRTTYVSRLGLTASKGEGEGEYRPVKFEAGYILRTGASWKGPIGEGEVAIWHGGPRTLRSFRALEPTEKDDLSIPLDLVQQPSRGRPLFHVDYGNTSIAEPAPPSRFERASVVLASSSSREGTGLRLGAMALDRDPETAWVDGGARGGAGAWLQIPTHALGRIRGLHLESRSPAPREARAREVRLTCLDLQGNERSLREEGGPTLELADAPSQRVLLERPVGPCYALRLTVLRTYGLPEAHVKVSEVALIAEAE
jgi:hypothetical protein